jgi:hypothetical protein
MATTVSSTPLSSQKLENIFPTLVDDFRQISHNFTKFAKIRKEQDAIILREKYGIRQAAYKSKFTSKVEKKYESKPLLEQSRGFLSFLKGVSGALGAAFLILGVAGIAKMLLLSNAGTYISKFMIAAFESVVDLFKKVIHFLKDILNNSAIKEAFAKAFNSLFQLVGNFLTKSFEIVKALFNDREVIQSIISTIIALFSAIAYAVQSSYNIIKNLFDNDIGSIKTNLINLFSKLVDIFVNVLQVTGNLFQSLMHNGEFLNNLKNIFSGLVNLVVEAFKYDYMNNKTGERVNILAEVGKIIAEAAILYAASKILKLKFMEYGAAIYALPPDGPGVPLPGDNKGQQGQQGKGNNTGRGVATAGAANAANEVGKKVAKDRLAQVAKAQMSKASMIDKIKFYLTQQKTRLIRFFELLRYRPDAIGRLSNVVAKIAYRVGVKASESTILRIAGSILVNLFAYASGLVTAGGGTALGILMTAANIALYGWLGYEIFVLIMDNFDEILDEAEADRGEEPTTPTQTENANQPAEVEPMATQADVRRIDNAIEAEQSATPTPAIQTSTTNASYVTPTPTGDSTIYAIGDSHAGGVSNYGKRKGYQFLGKNGSPALLKGKLNPLHLDAINSIPEGSNVVISLGANDVSIYANRKISDIVKDVTSVIGAAQKKGHKVTYLLPTLPKDPNHKDFARRNELREALRAAVNVPIVDLGVATSSDGIHHSNYSQFASQIKPTATNAAPTTNAIPTPDANAEKINLTDAQNIIKPGSETLIQTFKNIVDTNKVGPDTEKKNTIAGVLMAQLSSQLKALDEMTGGKIGASSSDLNEALRYLEDEFNQGTSIFDLSSKAAVHKTQTMVNTPPNIQKTNQNILNAILKRQIS